MSELLLGIDIGTFSSKAALVTVTGEVLRTAVVPHGIATPAPGHVEQDADGIWWHDVCVLCRQLLDGAPYGGGDVAAVAVSAIGPCLLPLDAAGRPLRRAILYGVDVRSGDEIAELDALVGREEILRFSLMGLTSQAIGPKIRWLRKREPGRVASDQPPHHRQRLSGLALVRRAPDRSAHRQPFLAAV
jgi:xylulokinase